MSKVTVSVVVEENTYKVGQGVGKFVAEMKAAAADGWDATKDVPAALKAVMGDLVPVLGSLGAVPGEALEDKQAFANAIALSVTAALL